MARTSLCIGASCFRAVENGPDPYASSHEIRDWLDC